MAKHGKRSSRPDVVGLPGLLRDQFSHVVYA